ncbi:Alpha/Beta hydrolase protein [Gorgonomyces haynaldii]|nr:Alpha/Beta hydrolase protein [Gorgonomyces haynaldii]
MRFVLSLQVPLQKGVVPESSIQLYQSFVNYTTSAYCPELDTWSCVPCTDKNVTGVRDFGDYDMDAYGYIALNHIRKLIILSFRGTRNLENWLRDLMFAKPDVPFPDAPDGAQVHYGFLTTWMYLRVYVVEFLKEYRLKHPDYRILVTGHSLGGAITTLCVMDLVSSFGYYPQDFIVFTLSQPRVGNQIFAEWFAQQGFQSVRVTNQEDLTPHLPPLWMQFRHVPSEVWIADEDGTTFECEPDDDFESKDCANSKKGYSISRHGEVWQIPLGIKSCLSFDENRQGKEEGGARDSK